MSTFGCGVLIENMFLIPKSTLIDYIMFGRIECEEIGLHKIHLPNTPQGFCFRQQLFYCFHLDVVVVVNVGFFGGLYK